MVFVTGKYNFFISYCRKDGYEFAQNLYALLTEKGYSVFFDNEMISGNFMDTINNAIINCDCFIPVITETYISSEWTFHELKQAMSAANGRARDVLPIVLCSKEQFKKVKIYFNKYHQIFVDKNDNMEIIEAANIIDERFGYKIKSALLYEKLSEFSKIKNYNKEAETICELLCLLRKRFISTPKVLYHRVELCKEMYQLYERLSKYGGSYDAESKNTASIILEELNKMIELLHSESNYSRGNMFLKNIFCISLAIRIIYLDREIRNECIDIRTTGDYYEYFTVEKYISKQEIFVKAFYEQYDRNKINLRKDSGFTKEDILFIEETPAYIFSIDKTEKTQIKQKEKEQKEIVRSEDEEILISIANFMREGNNLFDVLRKKGIAGDFLKCLLTSYERLKNYCEIVGADEVTTECVEQMAEIRNELAHSGANQNNEKAEKGIKSLLGITIPGTGNYDVFISFKSQDEDLGKTVYDYFRKNMKEPFWSKVSLPELSESEYEKAIYNALDKAKHFVVVLSDLSYMEDSWVEKEMRIFHREKNENRKPKDSNFVFVVTDDLYGEIIKSNKMLIPIEYRGYQIIKMSEYKTTLLQYVK